MVVNNMTFVCQLDEQKINLVKDRVLESIYKDLGSNVSISEYAETLQNALDGRLVDLEDHIDISDLISS